MEDSQFGLWVGKAGSECVMRHFEMFAKNVDLDVFSTSSQEEQYYCSS